jgi:hypothetical protein
VLSRRGFLGSLLKGGAALTAAAAVPVFDPEHALWLPGARTFFDLGAGRSERDWFDAWCDDELTQPVDAVVICGRNNLLTTDIITREALAVLQKQLTFANVVNRSYDDKFGCVEPGSVIRVQPPRLDILHGSGAIDSGRAVRQFERLLMGAGRGL